MRHLFSSGLSFSVVPLDTLDHQELHDPLETQVYQDPLDTLEPQDHQEAQKPHEDQDYQEPQQEVRRRLPSFVLSPAVNWNSLSGGLQLPDFSIITLSVRRH